ncbi:mCG146868 [Mus musculus]|nr:mCG146868 [Mus musculus]
MPESLDEAYFIRWMMILMLFDLIGHGPQPIWILMWLTIPWTANTSNEAKKLSR